MVYTANKHCGHTYERHAPSRRRQVSGWAVATPGLQRSTADHGVICTGPPFAFPLRTLRFFCVSFGDFFSVVVYVYALSSVYTLFLLLLVLILITSNLYVYLYFYFYFYVYCNFYVYLYVHFFTYTSTYTYTYTHTSTVAYTSYF